MKNRFVAEILSFFSCLYALFEFFIDKEIFRSYSTLKKIDGKRRFHGAFTGGFSAGHWNTVGTEEGWAPKGRD